MNAPLHDLIAAIGIQATLRLVAERGGRRCYIPTPARLTQDCPLVVIIGVCAAAKLAELWPGVWLTIPRAMPYMRRQRDRDIRARYAAGATAAALATEFWLTERQVYGITSQQAALDEQDYEHKNAAQLTLFSQS